jgi:hypothetical protein
MREDYNTDIYRIDNNCGSFVWLERILINEGKVDYTEDYRVVSKREFRQMKKQGRIKNTILYREMEVRQEVLDNAIEIYENMNVENIEPYMPANGTEGDIFLSNWCSRCKKNEISCSILCDAYFSDQSSQWIYWNNKPTCIAFELIIDSEK